MSSKTPPLKRAVDLDVDIGADAVDYNAIAKAESLSGLEVEMRKLEGVVKEIVDELNYLKRREARMRDTNGQHRVCFGGPAAAQNCPTESTNDRVRRFSTLTIVVLIFSGLWQIWYLRRCAAPFLPAGAVRLTSCTGSSSARTSSNSLITALQSIYTCPQVTREIRASRRPTPRPRDQKRR